MAWFRVYDTLLDNAKVQRLRPELFKALINLWCLAKRNNGALPPQDEIAFALRASEKDAAKWINALCEAELFDEDDGMLHPHDWDTHQFESDNVSERVRKHRQKRKGNAPRNEDETLHETPPDTETEQKQNRTESEGAPTRLARRYAFEGKVIRLIEEDFEAWRKSYPQLDLRACLQQRDDWLRGQPDGAERWFISTSNWLAGKQAEVAKANGASAPPEFQDTDEAGWRNRYEAWVKNSGAWPGKWGPRPGQSGHQGPPELEREALLEIPEEL